MRPRMVSILAAIGVFATYFTSTTCTAIGGQPEWTLPAKELPAACRKAKADFRPLGPADVRQAKATLLQAVDRLEQRLAEAGTNGQEWRKYLQVNALRKQLEGPAGPDKALLSHIRAHYNSGHEGLELVWFLDVERALHDYLAVMGGVDSPRVRPVFEAKLDKLAVSLERYASKPATDDALAISESLRWLEGARQVPGLVRAIEARYQQANVFGQMSPAILGAGIAEHIDETIPVEDCILGTQICGTAHTVGQTRVELVPNSEVGVFDTLFVGKTTSSNVGYHSPVTIYSNSSIDLTARKRVCVHPEGLTSDPGDSNATTQVQICDIQSNKGRAIVERMAWKRAGQQQGEAESIASRHAEQRLNERMDHQGDEALQRANKTYVDKFYRPFTERKLFPQELRYSSTQRAICMVALQAGGGKVGAPGTPPPVPEEAEMSLRLHESAINNLAFDTLAGRTVYEEKVQATVTETLGHLPEKMKGDEDGKPWAITFAPRQPISVTLADDGFKVTIRGLRFCKGQEIHNDPMNISAAYKIEKSAHGFKAVRQGKIEVLPPSGKMGGKQAGIAVLLEKRFAKIFEPEILGEGFELSGKWKAAGKLLPIYVGCRDGWLVIGWRRAAAADPKAIAAK
jgi:hypothetical protein